MVVAVPSGWLPILSAEEWRVAMIRERDGFFSPRAHGQALAGLGLGLRVMERGGGDTRIRISALPT